MNIKSYLVGIEKFINKKSPVILTGFAVAGVVSTAYFTATGTIKAHDIYLKSVEIDELGNLVFPTKTQIVKSCWKCYTPAFISATVSAACMIGATSVNCKRNVALASAYALSTDAYKTLKMRTDEELSASKRQKMRDAEASEKRKVVDSGQVFVAGEGRMLCCESLGCQYFRSTIAEIDSAINRANEELLNEGYISLNGVYDYLGLKHSSLGAELGWEAADGLITISYGSDLTEGKEPFLLVQFDGFPKMYNRYG